jgi:protein associated with RNAse G/E
MWVKSKISKKGDYGWNSYYCKIPGTTFLADEGDSVWIGYYIDRNMVNDRHIEILDVNDLIKIQHHREAAKYYPQPMEKQLTMPVE